MYVSSSPGSTLLPSIFVVVPLLKTSFFGFVGVGFVTSLVSYSFLPSFTLALFFMISPFTSALTFTLNLTVTLLSFSTSFVQVIVPLLFVPPSSADTNSVKSGILSVIVAVTFSPVVFL